MRCKCHVAACLTEARLGPRSRQSQGREVYLEDKSTDGVSLAWVPSKCEVRIDKHTRRRRLRPPQSPPAPSSLAPLDYSLHQGLGSINRVIRPSRLTPDSINRGEDTSPLLSRLPTQSYPRYCTILCYIRFCKSARTCVIHINKEPTPRPWFSYLIYLNFPLGYQSRLARSPISLV